MLDLFRNFLRSPGLKLFLVGFLVVILLLPLSLVEDLIRERSSRADGVGNQVGGQWGREQVISGPLLVVPYVVRVEKSENGQRVEKQEERVGIFTPDALDVAGQLDAKKLHRSIYDVPVYRARLKLSGRFGAVHIAEVESGPVEAVRWSDAKFVLPLSSVAGLKSAAVLRIDDATTIAFAPSAGIGQTKCGSPCNSGIHARLAGAPGFDYGPDKGFAFAVELDFNGSISLNVAPVARETHLSLKSDWPSPSFQGAFLPSEREVRSDGFSASWTVPQLARSVPAAWLLSEAGPERLTFYAFGVSLVDPVNAYVLLNRAVKYGILFIATAFMAVFCLEMTAGQRLHSVQYLLTGIALIFFYILLLSLSEHMGFDSAYGLGASAMVLMVASYVGGVMKSLRRGLVMAVVLFALMAILYFTLRLEDYALLVGSLVGLVALGATMFATRRVNWSGATGAASDQA